MSLMVKICGICSLDQAESGIEAGADLLGFNFYPPSPRYIHPSRCEEIVAGLQKLRHKVRLVGIFVNTPPEEIYKIIQRCGLDLAQLSGDEPSEVLEQLYGRAYKAIRPASRTTGVKQSQLYARRNQTPSLLLDASQAGLYGGTGRIADWEFARSLSKDFSLLLAGGLTLKNVASAVTQVRPWGVDVASGVESAPGVKDAYQMDAFVHAAKTAFAELEVLALR